MRVDLPAPFSPQSACTSPRRTRRWMSSFATTPGNRLVIPTSSTAYPPPSCTPTSCTAVDSAMPSPGALVGSRGRLPLRRAGHRDLAADDRRLVRVQLRRDVRQVVARGGVPHAVHL